MRTTLSIDDDLAESIEKLRARRKQSLREAIDLLLRAGLRSLADSARLAHGACFDSEQQPGIDPNRMNQLADELEIEEFVS